MAFITFNDRTTQKTYQINPRIVVSFRRYTTKVNNVDTEYLQIRTINNNSFVTTENIDKIVSDLDGFITPGKNIYTYKGQVNTVADLDNISTKSTGDVYNVRENNNNYAWSGNSWDNIGGMYTLQPATATTLGGIKIGKSLQVQTDGTTDKKTYIHTQTTLSNEWSITHNLNAYPTVVVIDSNGNECECEIVYTTANSLKIKSNIPFKGLAYLN